MKRNGRNRKRKVSKRTSSMIRPTYDKKPLPELQSSSLSHSSFLPMLNDDVLQNILHFVGFRSYAIFGLINKRCNIFFVNHMKKAKESFYGYASPSTISNLYQNTSTKTMVPTQPNKRRKMEPSSQETLKKIRQAVTHAIVYHSRMDLLDFVLQKQILKREIKLVGEVCVMACQIHNGIPILEKIFQLRGTQEKMIERTWIVQSTRLCYEAAKSGNLKTLKFLREDCELDWDWRTIACAASNGHLDICQFAFDRGCAMNRKLTSIDAAREGQLRVLKWMVGNGVCLDKSACSVEACKYGHSHIVRWLNEL